MPQDFPATALRLLSKLAGLNENVLQALLDRFMHDPNDPASASDALLKAAALYEREELVFRNKSSDVFSRERESYPVWE